MSSVEVKTADTYKDDGHAYRQGLMDPHMGVIEPGLLCPTDNCKYDESPGHFGHIQLELPVIHIGFVNLIKTALKATCNSCSKILLHSAGGTAPGMANDDEPSEQDYYRKRVHDIILKHGVGSTEFSKIIKETFISIIVSWHFEDIFLANPNTQSAIRDAAFPCWRARPDSHGEPGLHRESPAPSTPTATVISSAGQLEELRTLHPIAKEP